MQIIICPNVNSSILYLYKDNQILNTLSIDNYDIANTQSLTNKILLLLADTHINQIKQVGLYLLFSADCFDSIEPISKKSIEKFITLLPHFPEYVLGVRNILSAINEICSLENIPCHIFTNNGFFKGLPDYEKRYAIPAEINKSLKISNIKRWGHHGLLHQYNADISNGKNIISIVLDKQTTISAIRKGKPLTISSGFTPLEGIIGEKNCGDVDPGILFQILRKEKISLYKLNDILKKESGFAGITGFQASIPELIKHMGVNKKVDLALDIYYQHLLKYLGDSISVLGKFDCIVFSGKYQEALQFLKLKLIKQLSFCDIKLKALPWEEKNNGIVKITEDNSSVNIYSHSESISTVISHQLNKDDFFPI